MRIGSEIKGIMMSIRRLKERNERDYDRNGISK